MRISDWSSDVCSSDLPGHAEQRRADAGRDGIADDQQLRRAGNDDEAGGGDGESQPKLQGHGGVRSPGWVPQTGSQLRNRPGCKAFSVPPAAGPPSAPRRRVAEQGPEATLSSTAERRGGRAWVGRWNRKGG